MTQPVPEESNEALDVSEQPPGTRDDDLPDEDDAGHETAAERANAESSEGEPSGGN